MDRKTSWLIVSCVFLAVATFAVYSPVLSHPFVRYDDQHYVTENPRVQAGLTWNTVTWALSATEQDNWHPLTWISHALDCQLYGLKPGGHHLTSLLLHTLNVVLLFLLLERLTGATGRSFLVAALFALHPLNVESVAWVAERKNVLSTMFLLLTLGAYAWYARRPGVQRYLVVVALFALGLASKPMVITIPFLLLLLDFWPLERMGSATSAASSKRRKAGKTLAADATMQARLHMSPVPFWRLVYEKLPLFGLCAASAAITIFAQQTGGAVRTLERFPFWWRAGNAINSYALYLWKTFWPLQLAAYYPARRNLAGWQVLLAALFLAGVSLLVWKQRGSRRYLLMGWLWYLGTLVPVIGLVQVGDQAMADRYAYVPLIGVFVMAAWGAGDWLDSIKLGFRPRLASAVAILVALSFLTWRQIGYWRSDYDLWTHTLQVTKVNALAEESLAAALLMMGRAEEALPGLEKAVRLSPSDPMKHVNLGAGLVQSDRLEDAIREYKTAIELTSNPWIKVRCYDTLATLYDELGDYTNVRESYRQASQIAPQMIPELIGQLSENVATEQNAARYFQLGALHQEAGNLTEARAAYEQALKLDSTLQAAKDAIADMDRPNK